MRFCSQSWWDQEKGEPSEKSLSVFFVESIQRESFSLSLSFPTTEQITSTLCLDSCSRQCAQKLANDQWTFSRKREVKISPRREMKIDSSFQYIWLFYPGIYLQDKQVDFHLTILPQFLSQQTNGSTLPFRPKKDFLLPSFFSSRHHHARQTTRLRIV